MTTLHDDPSEFADDQLDGFAALHADLLRRVPGGVVAHRDGHARVAVVIGGGSGHYPAFTGLVGQGFATGAVVGNVFTSPSAAQVYSVARAADQGAGVVLSFGNYAGDTMNFGIAADRLRREGIDTRIVVVTDDVASAADPAARRGIAGDFVVFKSLGAAASSGASLDEVERVGRAANEATRTLGVAFSGCTMPGATEPLFTVRGGHLGLGLGIHGEPGIADVPRGTASELARLLVGRLLEERPRRSSSRVAAVVNGLGTTKYEELFVLWSRIAPLLEAAGLEVVGPQVGELVTSLDMGGCSLTLQWLDPELERLWLADAYTPAFRRLAAPLTGLIAATDDVGIAGADDVPDASDAARRSALVVRRAIVAARELLVAHEAELGRIDAVAGDGDHGRGMTRGVEAATRSIETQSESAGCAWLLAVAGRSWAERAGGTSGVLWGAGLEAAAASLTDARAQYTAADVADAVDAFAAAIVELGRAGEGDKTMLDALLPFARCLRAGVDDGRSLARAWASAAAAAQAYAAGSADLRPRVGRARPLADRSVGTPDAGATSLALIVGCLGAFMTPAASDGTTASPSERTPA